MSKLGLQVSPSEVINLGRVSSFRMGNADSIEILVGSGVHTVTTNEHSGSDGNVSESEFNRIKSELEAYFDVSLSAE